MVMRRVAALLAAIALTASLAGSSLAATSPTRNSFIGDFDQVDENGLVYGHITSQLQMPTAQRLVPGSYDFRGSPDNPFGIRESHAQIGHAGFWFDPNHPEPGGQGSNVAFGEGVECVYFEPGNTACHEFAVMFIDPLDPALPDQVAFANGHDPETGEWDFAYWFLVGKGDFVLKYFGDI
jgi:hypothetical protein